jgi:outer membrane lipoprotein SlyB
MSTKRIITSAQVCCLFLTFLVFVANLATVEAQTDWGTQQQPAKRVKPPAYTPPPDKMIYFRPGPKEGSVGVSVTNVNYPGLPDNLNYLKQTIELLEDLGYNVPENNAQRAVEIRVAAKYTQVDNSQAVAGEVGSKTAAGAVLGALTGFAFGGGRGAAEGAAGGAAYGVTSGSAAPAVLRYLTVDFDISSKRGGTQLGQVSKDITNIDMRPEQYIDAVIADYLEAALAKRH